MFLPQNRTTQDGRLLVKKKHILKLQQRIGEFDWEARVCVEVLWILFAART